MITPTVLCAGCDEGGLMITPTILCAGCGEGGLKITPTVLCVGGTATKRSITQRLCHLT